MSSKLRALAWFSVSAWYSAIFAGVAVNVSRGPLRFFAVFMAVHGALWAIYRALQVFGLECLSGDSDVD